ncbi:MAG: uracil-DNA glycosylase [Hyphomicrobiales bacterium]|nr:MAG: uracil-DNA glycosylase [Hyphomicrobiales bacterium]
MTESAKVKADELSFEAARSLLAWQLEMGADEAIGETAGNRFAESETIRDQHHDNPLQRAQDASARKAAPRTAPKSAPSAPAAEAPLRPPPAADISTDEAVMAARYLARECGTLEELREAMTGFDGCALSATAKQLVFADGNPEARLMLIGEAPGRDEDLQGKAFVGRAGQLLDRMLAAIGLDRHAGEAAQAAYITNVVPWRPPGNRNPTPGELAVCRPFIDRHVELARPDIVLLLGGVAAKELLATQTGIMRLRGSWRELKTGAGSFRAMASFHPAFLLRQPAQKRLAWRDLLAVQAALDERGGA